jgi:hypothetical protein
VQEVLLPELPEMSRSVHLALVQRRSAVAGGRRPDAAV